MPGVYYHSDKDGAHNPLIATGLIGKSTWIRAGDILLLTNVSGRAGTSGPRVVRPLYGADLSNGARTNGVLGVALYEIRTDSAGKVITPNITEVTLTGPDVIYPLPTIEYSQQDPASGFVRVFFARWCDANRFRLKIASTQQLLETDLYSRAGLACSVSTITLGDPSAITYTADKASTGKMGLIAGRILEKSTDTGNGQQWVVIEPMASTDQLANGDTATT